MSLYHIRSYLSQRTQSYKTKEVEYFLLCYRGKWAGGHSFARQHGCCNINVPNFKQHYLLHLLVYRLETFGDLSKRGNLNCGKKLVKKLFNLNF